MPGAVTTTGPFFTKAGEILRDMFEGALEEAARVGAELVRDRTPAGVRDSIVGEVKTSRRGRKYGQVRWKPGSKRGLRARVPGRRLWLEQGVRIEGEAGFDYRNAKKVKSRFKGHKMFLRGRQALKAREKAITEKQAGIATRKFR